MSGVIFDLDGTLIDSAPDVHRVANEVLTEEGFTPLSFERSRSFIGNGIDHFVSRMLAEHGLEDDTRHARMVASFLARYEGGHTLTKLYPGVREALQALGKAGHPLAICTNKPIGPTNSVLAHFGLTDSFAAIIGGDSLPERKPHPAPLLHTASLLGTPHPVFVGDSEIDAETAERAGQPFVLYTPGYRKSPLDTIKHAASFDDFSALPDLVTKLRATA